MTGTLFVCATPIGNLDDASPRLIDILARCPVIFAEDTRRTLKLLNHFQIKAQLQTYFQHNEAMVMDKAIALLLRGENVALVSDAGVPTVADPGQVLIEKCHKLAIPVIPISGPSAVMTALCASGFFAQTFNFRNFLPRKQGALAKSLQSIASEKRTTVIFESPNRVVELLESISRFMPECEVCLCREMTKIHESYLRGKPFEVAQRLGSDEIKGEITIVIGFPDAQNDQDSSYC
jgi:16S rRNA (cytidine1402-2'-O)-methyltransferase